MGGFGVGNDILAQGATHSKVWLWGVRLKAYFTNDIPVWGEGSSLVEEPTPVVCSTGIRAGNLDINHFQTRSSFPGVGHPLLWWGSHCSFSLCSPDTPPAPHPTLRISRSTFLPGFSIPGGHNGHPHPHPTFTQPCDLPTLPDPGSSHRNNVTALLAPSSPSLLLPFCPMGPRRSPFLCNSCHHLLLEKTKVSSGLLRIAPSPFHPLGFTGRAVCALLIPSVWSPRRSGTWNPLLCLWKVTFLPSIEQTACFLSFGGREMDSLCSPLSPDFSPGEYSVNE